ncbi:hypothetical protein AC1031_000914 [Aphanomyces cochlioides]|nr:hypothetical protein AC1031_000914 [Aphanomyces cochlioides]
MQECTTTTTATSLSGGDTPLTTIEFKICKRRRDCMINQRRYRERKRGKYIRLEQYVSELVEKTHMMEEHASLLHSSLIMRYEQAGAQRCHSISSYLRLFQHGLFHPHEVEFTTQMDVVRGVMSDGLQFNGEIGGPHSLIRHWEAYRSTFPRLDMHASAIEAHGAEHDIVIAYTILVLVFTRETLIQLFPHALRREDLIQKLVGVELAFKLRMSFSFDDARVAVMEAEVHMIEGLLDVLGSMEDSLFLIEGPTGEGGFLTPNGLIVPKSSTADSTLPATEDVKRRIDFILC